MVCFVVVVDFRFLFGLCASFDFGVDGRMVYIYIRRSLYLVAPYRFAGGIYICMMKIKLMINGLKCTITCVNGKMLFH